MRCVCAKPQPRRSKVIKELIASIRVSDFSPLSPTTLHTRPRQVTAGTAIPHSGGERRDPTPQRDLAPKFVTVSAQVDRLPAQQRPQVVHVQLQLLQGGAPQGAAPHVLHD